MVLHAGDMEHVLPELVWHLEDLRVGQCYPNYYVARLASKFVQGRAVRRRRRRAVRRLSVALLPRACSDERRRTTIDEYYDYWQRLVPDSDRAGVLQRATSGATSSSIEPRDIFRDVFAGARLPAAQRPRTSSMHSLYFEAKTFLHGLLVVEDKLSMAHGLETRVPFLDNDLVDFALRVPVRAQAARPRRDVDGRRERARHKTRGIVAADRRRQAACCARRWHDYAADRDRRADEAGLLRAGRELVPRREHRLRQPAAPRSAARLYEFLEPAYVAGVLDEHTFRPRQPSAADLVAPELRDLVPDVPAVSRATGRSRTRGRRSTQSDRERTDARHEQRHDRRR